METGLPRMLTSYESDVMASATATAAGGGGHAGAGPVGSGAAASSAAAGGIGAAAAAAAAASSASSAGAAGGGASSSSTATAKALGDLRRMYQLFLDVKTTVTWRGPGGGGGAGGAGASSGASSGVSARVRVVPPILLLRDVIKAHVVARGCAIVVDPESKKSPVSFVQVSAPAGRGRGRVYL
jgi:hypothetical protein